MASNDQQQETPNLLLSNLDLQRTIANAVTLVCHKSFAFINFVHVTGRLSFNVDNDHVSHVSVSEIVKPQAFLFDQNTDLDSSLNLLDSNTDVVPPVRITKAPVKKPTQTGRKRGRPPKKSIDIVEESWLASVKDEEQSAESKGERGTEDGAEGSGLMEVVGAIDYINTDNDLDDAADSDYIPSDGSDVEYRPSSGRRKSRKSEVNIRPKRTKSHTPRKIFSCDTCSYSSPYARVLAKHKLRHQLEDSPQPPEPVEQEEEDEDEIAPIKDEENSSEDTPTEETPGEAATESTPEAKPDRKQEGDETDEKGEEGEATKYKCEECPYETDHSGHYRDHVNRHKGIKPHKCASCDKSFTTTDDLKRHSETHTRTYECSMCQDVLPNKEALKQHAKEVHGETKRLVMPSCEICKKRLPTLSALRTHINEKHDNICSICGEAFSLRADLKKHREKMHPVENLTCNICSKKCSTKGALRKHIHRHREGDNFVCDICGKNFTAQSTLYHHKRGIHGAEKPYSCDKCGKSFNFHHSLKLHILRHNGLRPHKCNICGKTYLTATHLKSHIEAVHSETKKFKCVICNKNFPYENSLRMHMMLHTGERPFLCNICGRGFVSRSALKTHEASHVTDKAFECDICNKKYKTEMLLRAHKRRHTEDGSRFMCDICGHTFMYKSNLEAHYTVHGTERNFECNICGKTFKTHATLYSHKVVHKEDSPYMCAVCGKSFKSKERKLAHEKRHLGLKPFSCDLCNRAFPDKGGLSKHKKTVHATMKKFACPNCGKTCARADNLRVHMRIHGDPKLLKLSHEDLMIKTDPRMASRDDDNSGHTTPQNTQPEVHQQIIPPQQQPEQRDIPPSTRPSDNLNHNHNPNPIFHPLVPIQSLPPGPPPPLQPQPAGPTATPVPSMHGIHTVTIDTSELDLTATSNQPVQPGPSASSVHLMGLNQQMGSSQSNPQHALVLTSSASLSQEPKTQESQMSTPSLTMLTPAHAIIQPPTTVSQPTDYTTEVANAMLYMQYQTYLSTQNNVQHPH